MDRQAVINQAVDYLAARGVSVPPEVAAMGKSRAIKQAYYYQQVRNTLWAAVYDAVYDFLSRPNIPRTGPNTRMRIAVTESYQDAGVFGYQDGGGALPFDEDTNSYLGMEIASQNAFVDSLFQRLLELRREGDFDPIQEAFRAADRWTSALDGHYNYMKMAGAQNKMLSWVLGPTDTHCKDCTRLEGQRHRASWYRRRNYIPRKAGADMECQGYRCQCALIDDQGIEFSI